MSNQLQLDLDLLLARSESWSLKINPGKCAAMRFGGKPNLSGMSCQKYSIDGHAIDWAQSHRDLGVIVDCSLRFHSHVNMVAGKSSALSNQLLRSTVCRDRDFMVSVFVAHIRPIIDYASTVWNVGYMGDVRKLERVQRRWTRETIGMTGLDYQDRLKDMGLFSIYGRLLRADLIKIWKCFHSDVDVGLSTLLEQQSHAATRNHGFKLSIPRCRSEVRRRFWGVRGVSLWNSLPASIVQSTSLETFKKRLDSHMEGEFYKTIDGL